MNLGLEGKVILVTGGTSGIGKAAALAFAREGCRLAVCGRSGAKLEALRAAFAGMPLHAERADVSRIDEMEAFAAHAAERFGRIDVWINNAGISDPMPFDETDEQAFDRMIDINLKSVFFGSAIAARHMRKTGGGVILNTSSFTSILPTAGKALYGATKAAVDSLTRTLAAELAADGIRVVSIIPGYIQTEMTEANIEANRDWLLSGIALGRLGIPEDLAGAYVFLASDAASYITGISLPVAGGKLCVQNPTWSRARREAAP